jgi:hypothetical protein
MVEATRVRQELDRSRRGETDSSRGRNRPAREQSREENHRWKRKREAKEARERGMMLGEIKVGQWPGHVEKNGVQRAGRRHTVLLIQRPLLAASGFRLPIQETASPLIVVKMRCDRHPSSMAEGKSLRRDYLNENELVSTHESV